MANTKCKYCGEVDCPRRHNVERQESVVDVLWQFAHDLQTKKLNTKVVDKESPLDGTAVNLDSVGDALKKIMRTFNYGVVPIQ